MATWIVGDIHGWPGVFDRLLTKIGLDTGRDRLWLVGDLVNRGPDSAGMLRRARDLEAVMGDRFACVLGNHDLHLLAAAEGLHNDAKPLLRRVRKAQDGDDLLGWLRCRPLLHVDAEVPGAALVHAGLWPWWTLEEARRRAAKVEKLLRGKKAKDLMKASYRLDLRGSDPRRLGSKIERRAADLFAFVHLRMLDAKARPCAHKGRPEDAPRGCVPWYAAKGRRSRGTTVAFGHWAALGLRTGDDWLAVDSGCSWGRKLAAVRLEDRKTKKVANPDGPI